MVGNCPSPVFPRDERGRRGRWMLTRFPPPSDLPSSTPLPESSAGDPQGNQDQPAKEKNVEWGDIPLVDPVPEEGEGCGVKKPHHHHCLPEDSKIPPETGHSPTLFVAWPQEGREAITLREAARTQQGTKKTKEIPVASLETASRLLAGQP